MTTVGVLREAEPGERRVALTPDGVERLLRQGAASALIEAGAGAAAFFFDDAYASSGATVVSRDDVYAQADVVLCVSPPPDAPDLCRPGQILIGLLSPLADPPFVGKLATTGVTAISLDMLPRTLSRAQAMDALTSQANVAGYQAALVAAEAYAGYFPMLMTAAGTTRPAQVLVLGAGVAGLQAIATARRLGALVTGFDVRAAARADIASTGAAVLALDTGGADGVGGYARGLDETEAAGQQRALAAAIGRFDVVITTAQVPGARPPLLLTEEAVGNLRPGSVVVDLASGPLGGNVAGSVAGTTTVTPGGVTLVGAGRLASSVPQAASTAYGRNLLAVLASLNPEGVDLGDEVHAAIVLTQDRRVVHPRVRDLLEAS